MVGAVSGLLLFWVAGAWAADESVRFSPEQAARAGIVTTALADLKRVAGLSLPAQVVVPPSQLEVIAAPLPGMITVVQTAYGETVRKGQVIARLQGMPLLELQREYASARNQATLAGDNLRRDESLFGDGIIAQGRLAATRAAEQQATLLLAEKRAALSLAGVAVPGAGGTGGVALSGRADVRAPFDGVVLEAAAQPGQRVDAATPLFKVGRLTPLWLEIQASPAQAGGVAVGDAVGVAGCTQPGRVTLVAPQLQMASQSLLIRAELPRPGACVKPFQYVQAQVAPARGAASGTWRVPPAALTRHQGQAWVFTAAADGFRAVAVKVIDEAPEATTLAVDLPPDARLVVRGVSTLKAAWLGLGAAEGK